ncbi:LamG domain-containing protein [Micromonospora sp. WMMD1120]|uniref:LamG domain-containing protein n=1 Tax=Micromonospora sp. WMMD1120 TaxID=3016106 RepID=UPI00241651D5|nr:LamG domain-containing protein [Micromonospora sp. WMMD1120]MDG4809374.1 LamG domain-containing protein [Micromonospora sp. WMMD1120]
MRLRQRRPRLGSSRKDRGVAVLALGALLSVSVAATPSYAAGKQLDEGLVHHFALDETSGTTLVNSGSAGAAANATLVNPGKATLTGEGVRLNPDSYEGALDGAYVALPNNITAGMSNLTVDYAVRIDPANVGEHHMWGFGRKSGSCDVDTGAEGSIFASNTQRFRVAVGSTNVQQNRVRMLEGAWTHVTYTQSLNSDGTSWTGRLYLDGVPHATSTNLTTPPSVNAAGTNCNFLGRSQTSSHYSFRGTIRDFRVYDRALSPDETLARAETTVSDGVRADAAAIDLGLTSAVVRDLVLPKTGAVAVRRSPGRVRTRRSWRSTRRPPSPAPARSR